MTAVQSFSPEAVQVIISNGQTSHTITNYMEGTFVTVEPAADRFSPTVGGKGEEYRALNPNRAFTVTIALSQTSHSNDVLYYLFDEDRETLDGLFNMIIKDASGTTLYSDEFSYIMTEPTQAFSGGGSIEGREWQIRMPKPDYVIGGNGRFSAATQRTVEQLGATVDPRWQSS